MYLHIGNKCVIPEENIIAIISKEMLENSEINNEFFEISFEEGFMVGSDDDEVKSYIITEGISKKNKDEHMMTRIYSSNISVSTLIKRIENKESL